MSSQIQNPTGSQNGYQPALHPRVLMLGMGWFPSTPGGLNRYYRSLLEQLPEASGVVVGPAEQTPATVHTVGGEGLPLAQRMIRFWRAARQGMAKAELIDSHFALYSAAALLAGKSREQPLVFHFHGPWADENIAAGDASWVRFALRSALERIVLRRADAYVVLSSAFRRVLVERYRVSPWEVNVWAPGVALEQFTPGDRSHARTQMGIDQDAFVVVCVRRLVPRMGIDCLLDAWQQAVRDLPDGSLLLLIGDGPLRQSFSERAAALSGVRVLGRVDEAELAEAYRVADVAVVPSVTLEGFGLVVAEAAACGTPSIVTDVGGLPEVTRPFDRSLVVAAADPSALGERIRSAARGQLPSRAATRSFAESFSWPELAGRHRALYRRLIDGERDQRLRVVYLDHVARLSGAEIAMMRLLTRFVNVNPHVILGEDGPLAERLAQAGVSVEVLPIAPFARDLRRDSVRLGSAAAMTAFSTCAYTTRLALRLRTLRPDLVHTNSLKAGVYGSIAAKAAGVPMLWHVRDRIADDYLPAPAVRLVRMLVRYLADGVVANSTSTLQTLPAAVRGPLSWVIPASVEPPDLPRRKTSDATTFGMLGRIAPWKGQDLFLRSFAAAFPDGDERAVLVGSALFGEEDYERELYALAGSLGISERVEFRGFREDVWPELASFDVLVHASIIPEPFGTVVLEGMGAGLAVIAPDEGGPASVIEDRQTGRLFRARDLDSLSATMRELRDDPGERIQLGTAARTAVAPYHPDVVAAHLERAYERVLITSGSQLP